ncbi:MAG: DUF460 domain-containing protein [Desulfurococcaceae archaeon]
MGGRVALGIDIRPGSSPEGGRASYAAVIVKDDGKIYEYDEVDLARVVRLAWEHGADYVAVDNVGELGLSVKSLAKFVELLPPNCKLVQVTGLPGTPGSLREVALRLGMDLKGKPDPTLSAYICARAALSGMGVELLDVGLATKVIISKARSPAQGGMSLNRYKRGVRAAVLEVTREVKRLLEERGLEFDLYFRKSEGGLERSLFVVYAPRNVVEEVVRARDLGNVRIRIEDVRRPKALVNREPRRTPIIVGIDPGMSVGLAIVDLEGRILKLKTFKDVDRNLIISEIVNAGKPVAIATDVAHPPELVKKVATALRVLLWLPERDLEVDEKQRLAMKALEAANAPRPENSHERDALASAMKMLNEISTKVSEIDKIVGQNEAKIDKGEILRMVLSGKSVSEAVEEYVRSKALEGPRRRASGVVKEARTTNGYSRPKQQERIAELEARIRSLEEEIRKRDELISELEAELRNLKRLQRASNDERERHLYMVKLKLDEAQDALSRMEEEIARLRAQLREALEALSQVATGEYIVVPVLDASRENPREAFHRIGRAFAIYTNDLKAIGQLATELLDSRTAVLVSADAPVELPVPVVRVTPERVLWNMFAIVSSSVMEEISRRWRELDKKREREQYLKLVRMVKEYQERRKNAWGMAGNSQ